MASQKVVVGVKKYGYIIPIHKLVVYLNLKKIVVVLDAQAQLEVLSDEGDWLKVSYNGNEGYVSSEFVTGDEPEDIPME